MMRDLEAPGQFEQLKNHVAFPSNCRLSSTELKHTFQMNRQHREDRQFYCSIDVDTFSLVHFRGFLQNHLKYNNKAKFYDVKNAVFISSNEWSLFNTLTLCSMLKRNQLRDVALEWQTLCEFYELVRVEQHVKNMRLGRAHIRKDKKKKNKTNKPASNNYFH